MATIVVMDEDESIRSALARFLQNEGYEVLAFNDAQPALETVDFEQMDLVVTDLQMPTPGEDAIRAIRSRGIQIPIVVISGLIDNKKVKELMALGAQKILKKPLDILKFLEVIRTLV